QDKLEKKVRLKEDKVAKIFTGESTLPNAEQEKIVKNCTAKVQKLSLDLGRVKVKLEKNDSRIAKIAERNCKGLAEDLEKTNANFKLKTWQVKKSNAVQARTKVWFNIANAVGKFAVVVFALVVAATNAFTVLPVALSLLAMGIVVDSIGLTKILLTDLWKPQTLPKQVFKPQFEALAV
ncbi:MAG TPA: hypothetical protein VGP47_01895, partial [Parachlamydiaceae bacterium]|nr:hypothetical protein [Parachlamydiaceae bacterium]